MFRNHLSIAIRNLMKYKFISFINLFGLTVGLTCCLLILTYIINELSYDRYNEHADRIYRVTRDFNNQDGAVNLRLSTISPPFGPYLLTDFPDIEKMTRLLNFDGSTLRYQDKIFNETGLYFADENLFDVFTVHVTKGNPKLALKDPFSIMLSEELAKKYFGNDEPLNKAIRINNQFNLKITGIFKSFPSNAHLHPEILVSFNTLKDSSIYGEENLRTNWGNNSFFTYLLMPKNYPVEKMIGQFTVFLDKHMDHKDFNGKDPSKFTRLGMQKLTDIHLRSHLDYEAEENGDIKRVYIFSAIALFILLIACINYMNLSTARSALRAREIGIRKVIGAQKKQLVFQFLSESILLTLLALVLAIAILWFALPGLNSISGQNMSIDLILNWKILLPILLTPFLVGFVAGIYPALFMSSFQPVKTLKGLFKSTGGNISLRKILVVAQFSISIILIICTMIVFQQLRYMQTKSLGYNKDHIINLLYYNNISDQYESFRNDLLRQPNVKNVTRSSRIPTGRLLDAMGASSMNGDSLQPINASLKFVAVDYDFADNYELSFAAGRNFSKSYGLDTSNFILNEAAVTAVGWKSPKEAIGKDFKYGRAKGYIIGVVKDFHFESLHQKIEPMIFILPAPSQSGFFNALSIKLSGENIPKTLASVESVWKNWLPDYPCQYSFLDEKFDKLYKSEQKQGTIFTIFSCIAIFIACLGLLGLSAFAISQRVKEIGIRKVLGASVRQIVTLISKDFLLLVGVSSIIAFPIAWFAMHNWLEDFAYRIGIAWWVFLISGLAATLIAFLTILFQTLKAGLANPAKSLRTE